MIISRGLSDKRVGLARNCSLLTVCKILGLALITTQGEAGFTKREGKKGKRKKKEKREQIPQFKPFTLLPRLKASAPFLVLARNSPVGKGHTFIFLAEKDDFRNRLQILQLGGGELAEFGLLIVTVIPPPFFSF